MEYIWYTKKTDVDGEFLEKKNHLADNQRDENNPQKTYPILDEKI